MTDYSTERRNEATSFLVSVALKLAATAPDDPNRDENIERVTDAKHSVLEGTSLPEARARFEDVYAVIDRLACGDIDKEVATAELTGIASDIGRIIDDYRPGLFYGSI